MITVIIPQRENSQYPELTVRSLLDQTFPPHIIKVVPDEGRGANYARNRGFESVVTPFVLFSDDDILWELNALKILYNTLLQYPNASYAYGWYEMGGKKYCDQPFDENLLKKKNYISTMSLIRTMDFPGFDESIQRLQDWDLWLTMLSEGKTGVYCNKKMFSTFVREGITYGFGSTWEEAFLIVQKKHGLER